MRFVFVHQNFPGQFLHLVRHLVSQNTHDIVFLTEPNANVLPGVRKVPYRRPDPPAAATHWTLRELEAAARRAETVAGAARTLRDLGFTPDIIIGHHGWGELLNLQDVWPGAPILGYYEFFYHTEGIDVGFDPEFPLSIGDFPRIRAKNAVNLLALASPGHGQTPTRWQLSTYPAWARDQITVLPEGVDLEICRPSSTTTHEPLVIGDHTIMPGEKLVTYVARDLEPYRGVHVLLRALPRILSARPNIRVVMVGGDGVSYGSAPAGTTWKALFLAELQGRLDLSRVIFPGRIPYATYVRLLQRSDAHVYLTYPFVASWSLREAIATGCAIVGSDTPPVREFISDRETGLLASFFSPADVAEKVLELLEAGPNVSKMRQSARDWALRHLDMAEYLSKYEDLIAKVAGRELMPLSTKKTGGAPFDARTVSHKSGVPLQKKLSARDDIKPTRPGKRSG